MKKHPVFSDGCSELARPFPGHGSKRRGGPTGLLTGPGRHSFVCWSLSFYPQPILNWRRKSTVGLALDFPTINMLGFVCYLISSLAFLYSPLIRRQYAARNPRSPEPTVRLNDLAFIVHGVVLSSVVYSQFYCWNFKRDRTDRLSMPIAGVFVGSLAGLLLVAAVVVVEGGDGGREPFGWAWIDVVRAPISPRVRRRSGAACRGWGPRRPDRRTQDLTGPALTSSFLPPFRSTPSATSS